MAANDFWNRITGFGITDATPAGQGKIPMHPLRALFMDVVIGNGGITVANAKTFLSLANTAATEFQDLIDSVTNVTNANADVQRGRREDIVEVLCGGGLIAERGTKIGGGTNPYQTGESLRLRVKALITALAPNGAAALVGSMAV